MEGSKRSDILEKVFAGMLQKNCYTSAGYFIIFVYILESPRCTVTKLLFSRVTDLHPVPEYNSLSLIIFHAVTFVFLSTWGWVSFVHGHCGKLWLWGITPSTMSQKANLLFHNTRLELKLKAFIDKCSPTPLCPSVSDSVTCSRINSTAATEVHH